MNDEHQTLAACKRKFEMGHAATLKDRIHELETVLQKIAKHVRRAFLQAKLVRRMPSERGVDMRERIPEKLVQIDFLHGTTYFEDKGEPKEFFEKAFAVIWPQKHIVKITRNILPIPEEC